MHEIVEKKLSCVLTVSENAWDYVIRGPLGTVPVRGLVQAFYSKKCNFFNP